VTAVCGFSTLDALVAAGRELRDTEVIAALEMIDRRAAALAAEHLGVPVPVDGDWLLLIELAGDTDLTERLADALDGANLADEPAVGIDAGAQQRLWQVRESTAEVVGLFGPPLKFDVSLPLSVIPAFAADSAALVAEHAPEAVPVLFGHIGEGNLHLNVLRCGTEQERHLYAAMMKLIAAQGGNVSSEHGIGSRKRAYLGMSREPADIAAMRAIKSAFDPTGYLNPAVLFD
jgi:FAD/FMN-containing dehydrogenase